MFQCGALLDKKSKQAFIEDVAEDYEDVRQNHYDSIKVNSCLIALVQSCAGRAAKLVVVFDS
jgi:hypothetical protein